MAATMTMATRPRPRRMRGLAMALACFLALGGLRGGPIAPAGAAGCAVTSAANAGAGTLRARLADASCTAITFDLAAMGGGTIALTSALPTITRALTVTGPGATRLGIHGDTTFPLLTVAAPGLAVGLSGLSLRYGKAVNSYGGNLRSEGANLALTDVFLTGATAAPERGGAGAYIGGGTSTLTGVSIAGNTAPGSTAFDAGAGLFVDDYYGDTAVTIANSTILDNHATANKGGGLAVVRDSGVAGRVLAVTLTNSTVGTPQYPNTAEYGGGIHAERATLTLIDSTVSGNQAGESGGGLFLFGPGTAALTRSIVSENVAGVDGGGLYMDSVTATLASSTISENQAGRSGGGFSDAYHGSVTLTNSTISGNQAGDSGGGFANRGASTTTLRFVTVTGNTAVRDDIGSVAGGGIFVGGGTTIVLSSIVAGNRRGLAAPDDCAGAIASQGRNLWGTQAPCPDSAGLGDQNLGALNVNLARVLDPALAYNGGPTRTHALVVGSPAIDHGDNLTCPVPIATDQRGVARNDGECDAGAHEYAPSPTTVALTITTVGGGTVGRSPAGTGGGPFGFTPGTEATLTPQPGAGQTFVGWTMDGVAKGWAPSLTVTMAADHAVQATFVPTASFPDVGGGRADYAAIVALASRGTIRGYAGGNFGPDDGVQRAQMAALIARATAAGPGTPPTSLAPPACLAGGTWDCEDWGNNFTDRQGLDVNLWRNIGALQHYGVAKGYDGAACAAKGVASPCYGPTAPVTYAETITFITRAMQAKGYWVAQPGAAQPYAGVPAVFAPEVATFAFYTGGVPLPPSNWNAGATRGWFAMALWRALDSYWGSDTAGRGGYVP